MLDFEWNFFGEKTSTIWSIVHSRCLEEHFQKNFFWKKYKNINLFVIPVNFFFTMMRNLLRQLFRTKFFSGIFVSFFPLFLSETLGEKTISGKKYFFENILTLSEVLLTLAKTSSCQSCILLAYTNFYREKILWTLSDIVRNPFWRLRKASVTTDKHEFYMSTGLIGEQYFFLKNCVFAIGLERWGKKLRTIIEKFVLSNFCILLEQRNTRR